MVIRLDGIIGIGTTATEIDEFTAGDGHGTATRSGEVCQRQTPTAAPRRWLNSTFAALFLERQPVLPSHKFHPISLSRGHKNMVKQPIFQDHHNCWQNGFTQ
ncbi:hypothetical protein LXL04_009245 [Taraxacum kok-saghyz]